MSDHHLLLVPVDPEFVPSPAAAECARAHLAALVPGSESVVSFVKDTVEFFSPAGNWSGVVCPHCHVDIEPWWGDAMDAAYQSAFADLSATTGCCARQVSLNELHYVWPAAFARFGIEATNPPIHDLEPEHQLQIEALLGCKLTKIWVHV